jgi:predicted dithiol-disulfide oxidoreductase (DUF899 family)
MKVGTEREWLAARRELLAAERELEQHAELVEEHRWDLLWVPVETDYRLAVDGAGRTPGAHDIATASITA